MEKRYGASGPQNGLEKIGTNRWAVFYGFGKDSEDAETGYNWYQTYNHRPTLDEIKADIVATINNETDRKILEGFVWKDMPVWLSTENQFNYKAAYDLAVQTNGATLPVRFKFGTDVAPVYYNFESLEDFADFYTQAIVYINTVLNEGWAEKDLADSVTFDTDE